MKGIIAVFTVLSMLFANVSVFAKDKVNPLAIAYIPIDDRPGNLERVQFAAQAAGIDLLVPPVDYIHTSLDNQPTNSNGKPYGNTAALLKWIKEVDKTTDNFIISLDQLLSGGLVNSRIGGLIRNEKDVISSIINLSKTNNVYVFDTVIRLASCTIGYKGGTVKLYEHLRSFFDRSPDIIHSMGPQIFVQETVSSQTSRQRKLEIIKYMLKSDTVGNINYYIGVDDSSSRDNVQLNEIEQIRGWLDNRGVVYSGTDEIGIMMLSHMVTGIYKSDIKAQITYFGGNEHSGTEYDFDTVHENLMSHLEGSGARAVDNVNEADLQILVMTLHDENGTQAEYAKDMMNEYYRSKKPVIMIDTAALMYDSRCGGYHNDFPKMSLYADTSKLLAFSCWNTGGNAIGMGIANGVSRLAYLKKVGISSDKAQEGFEKALVFAFAKDVGYKLKKDGGEAILNDYLTQRGYSTSNFYKDAEFVEWAMNNGVFVHCMSRAVSGINASIKGIEGDKLIVKPINSVKLSNYRAPWYRTFEITFDMEIN